MSFKNYYLTEAGEVDPNAQQQKPVDKEQPQQQPENPKAGNQPQAKEQQPQQNQQQNKPPEKKNKSLFGGKLYNAVSKFSKGLTKGTELVLKNYDATIKNIEKLGPGGKKLAAMINKTTGEIKAFKDKNPVIYSLLMNMSVGYLGSIAGNAAGAATRNAINFAEYESAMKEMDRINEKLSKIRGEGKHDEYQHTRGNIRYRDDGEVASQVERGDAASNTVKASDDWANKAAENLTDEEWATYQRLTQQNKAQLQMGKEVLTKDEHASSSWGDKEKGGRYGSYSGVSQASEIGGSLVPVAFQSIATLSAPSPGALGQVAFMAVLNALDKVDKKQMPASKYIATVVAKVKDEKKKKEMLASFIRMRAKQI